MSTALPSHSPYVIPKELRSLRQSDFGTALGCAAKLYLGKVLGHSRPASKKMLVGTAFHKGAENLYRSIKLGDRMDLSEAKAQAVASVQTGFALADVAALELEGTETVEDATIESGGLLIRALDYYAAEVLPGIIGLGTPMAIEERIEFDYRGFALNCTVDLIDGEASVRDHKFSGAYLGKTWPDSYLSQLARYAWFLSMVGVNVLDAKIDTISYAKANRKKDPILEHKTYDLAMSGLDMPTLIKVGKESVDQTLNLIEAGIFPRNGMNVFGLGCGNCPYKGALCVGADLPGSFSHPSAA